MTDSDVDIYCPGCGKVSSYQADDEAITNKRIECPFCGAQFVVKRLGR